MSLRKMGDIYQEIADLYEDIEGIDQVIALYKKDRKGNKILVTVGDEHDGFEVDLLVAIRILEMHKNMVNDKINSLKEEAK